MDNLSLRDYFAGRALSGLSTRQFSAADLAEVSYKIADAMLVERTKNVLHVETIEQAAQIFNRYLFLGCAWRKTPNPEIIEGILPSVNGGYLLPKYTAIATAQKLAEDNYGR